MKEFKYIFSLRLAGFLMENGFKLLRINHNLQVPNKDVYVFKNSKELEECMTKYSSKKNSKEIIKDDFNTNGGCKNYSSKY